MTRSSWSQPRYLLLMMILAAASVAIGLPAMLLQRLTSSSRTTAQERRAPSLSAVEAAAELVSAQPPAEWINEASRRGPDPDVMGPAGAALVSAVANELKLKRAELEGIAYALTKSTAAVAVELNMTRADLRRAQEEIRLLTLRVAALETPWWGQAGEVPCAFQHRCTNFVEAGEHNLSAISSVSACRSYCAREFPHVHFFAFHNEFGMVQFLQRA